LPGLVNAHCHLELSRLRGRTQRNLGMSGFVRQMMAQEPAEGARGEAVSSAINEALGEGTLLMGDVTNRAEHVPLLASSPLSGRLFVEVLGLEPGKAQELLARGRSLVRQSQKLLASREARGEWLVSLAPHAPYSMSRSLQEGVRREVDRNRDAISTLHLLESAAERELVQWGRGPLAQTLAEAGLSFPWSTQEQPWGASKVAGFWALANLLWVHGNYVTQRDMDRLARRVRGVVLCPRSNRYIGHDPAPLHSWRRAGARLALGTDSLASNDSLSMVEEMAQAVMDYGISPAEALSMAGEGGALALGFGDRAALAEGQRASWFALPLEGLGGLALSGGINVVNQLWERIFSWSSRPVTELFVAQ
jgi:cytosine/adenosine deaminase-related metal-dependent hydrolase